MAVLAVAPGALGSGCGSDDEERVRLGLETDRRLGQLPSESSPPAGGEAEARGGARVASVVVYRGAAESAPVSRVRAVVQLEGTVRFRRRERAGAGGGARAVLIDLEGAELSGTVPPILPVHAGGLSRIVWSEEPEGVVAHFEISEGARYQLYALEQPTRLVFDFEQPAGVDQGGEQLVLLDPGHGGEDFGSPGPFGLWEGRLTLDISRRTRAWLARLSPQVRVRLTRDSDVFLTLEERAAMANSLGAALFVSVHLNAATTTVDHGGVATYVLDVSNDRNVLRLAARENGTRTTDVSPMQFLVGQIARGEQRAASERLASLIQRGALVSGRRFLPTLADRGVKSAMFHVLVGAQMPAVLVEGSFITQPDEAAQLTTASYRDAIAEGIARGIAKYLAEN